MSVEIKGTVHKMEVDSNKRAMINTPMVDIEAGFQALLAENDAGTVTGERRVRAVELSSDFRVRIGQDNMIFKETFVGSLVNTTLWQTPVTTMTAVVGNGFMSLNAGSSLASGAVAQARTYRHFPCYKQYATYAEMEIALSSAPITGNKCEWGLMLASGVGLPTDGAFFRLDQARNFKAVMSYNGQETTSDELDVNLIGVNDTKSYLIYVGSASVQFWIDNILVAELFAPQGQGSTMSSMNMPLAFRNHNTAVTLSAQILRIGNTNVTFGDQAMSKPWGHVISGSGGHSSQGQTGTTLGSTALYTNAAPSAGAALSNVTAAAQFTGLGGIFNVLPTLAVGGDGILSSYLNPLGTSVLPGKTLYITGIRIDSVVTSALTGGAVIYALSLAYGHTAVSLATTESATTKAPRRVPVGLQVFDANAAQGARAEAIVYDLSASPISVSPGEYLQLAARNLGVVTSAGVVTFVSSFTGYWE